MTEEAAKKQEECLALEKLDALEEVINKGEQIVLKRKRLGSPGSPAYRPDRDIVEMAYTKAGGSFVGAANMFIRDDGIQVTGKAFASWVRAYEIELFPDRVKQKICRSALLTLVDLAVKERSEKAICKLLDTWGHLIGFTPNPIELNHNHTLHAELQEAFKSFDGKNLVRMRDKEIRYANVEIEVEEIEEKKDDTK
jgi:hypothetical protein